MKLRSGFVAGVLLTFAVPAGAQSLGDLARKEQERRKTAPPAAKTYTNEDLKKLPPLPGSDAGSKIGDKASAKSAATGTSSDAARPDDSAKAAVKGDASAPAEAAKDEKYWRGRITAVRDDVQHNQTFREALQNQINSLSADFSARDDPYQRAKIADDRQKKMAELARVTLEIEKATKLIGEIEEEARRAGVPPGWLR